MLNTKVLFNAPKFLLFKKDRKTLKKIDLLVHGQCVFLFDTEKETSFVFYNNFKSDGLIVSLSKEEFLVQRISNSEKYVSQIKTAGLTNKEGAYYWFSLDSQNELLQAGIGEARIETLCYSYQFNLQDQTLRKENKLFLESLVTLEIPNNDIAPIRLLKNPITTKIPLIVKGRNELTMVDVASNHCLPACSLSLAAQTLYDCVSGKNFILNTPDFPDFARAIEYSINTPGLWCNKRLKEKETEFGKDPKPLETYLRITLGQNNGESPGIPYVMEIWPIGHYSPVHNHSEANAIIRVLHGNIHVSLFPYLCNDPEGVEPFATKDFKTDDITWISSTLNQVHQLKNLETNETACITIQCYLYDSDDVKHYDYFDYLSNNNNNKEQYEPDSDMDFLEFKKKMREEWENVNKEK
jgi:hypothetical protein